MSPRDPKLWRVGFRGRSGSSLPFYSPSPVSLGPVVSGTRKGQGRDSFCRTLGDLVSFRSGSGRSTTVGEIPVPYKHDQNVLTVFFVPLGGSLTRGTKGPRDTRITSRSNASGTKPSVLRCSTPGALCPYTNICQYCLFFSGCPNTNLDQVDNAFYV